MARTLRIRNLPKTEITVRGPDGVLLGEFAAGLNPGLHPTRFAVSHEDYGRTATITIHFGPDAEAGDGD